MQINKNIDSLPSSLISTNTIFFVREVGMAVHLQQICNNISAAQVTADSESLKIHLYRFLSCLISSGSLNPCVQRDAKQKGVSIDLAHSKYIEYHK